MTSRERDLTYLAKEPLESFTHLSPKAGDKNGNKRAVWGPRLTSISSVLPSGAEMTTWLSLRSSLESSKAQRCAAPHRTSQHSIKAMQFACANHRPRVLCAMTSNPSLQGRMWLIRAQLGNMWRRGIWGR